VELSEQHHDLTSESPEHQVDVRLEQEQVRSALCALTPEQRQVIVLRFLEGFENDAVAVALQKPISAVKALQHRAIQSLRRMLLEDEKRKPYESEPGS
jgi:RNA polymerase sigma-70 factor (ECF subfamily)